VEIVFQQDLLARQADVSRFPIRICRHASVIGFLGGFKTAFFNDLPAAGGRVLSGVEGIGEGFPALAGADSGFLWRDKTYSFLSIEEREPRPMSDHFVQEDDMV
jgi:hypothetical protein